MYNIDKAQQLQKQSHVRGALSKQFYSNQQSELQKKRKQMKRILDEQVEEKKRVKQRQKQQQEMRQRKQEQEIKRYYQNVEQRQRRISEHSTVQNYQSSVQNYQYTNRQNQSLLNGQNQSLIKKHVQQQGLRQRVNSKTQMHQYDGGNYPLMPLMSLSEGQFNGSRATNPQNEYVTNSDRVSPHHYYTFEQNAGNIPLLDLSDQNQFLKNKKKSKTQVKKQPTERENNHLNNNQTNRNSIIKLQQSKYFNSNNPQSPQNHNNTNILVMQNNQSAQSFKKKERRRTLSNDQNFSVLQQQQQTNMLNSQLSKGSKVNQNFQMSKSPANTKRNTEMDIPQEIQQIQNQNRQLKSQLKKSQQAISLLIGAVRSNPKLDKFRVQAEKILHHQSQNYPKTSYHPQTKFTDKKQQNSFMLPKIKVKHQSIMHDYLFQAAKKARVKQIKSQAIKY